MKHLYFSLLTILLPGMMYAQGGREVSGIVRDSTGNSVIAATVRLTSPKDTLMTRSDVDGNFKFTNVQSSQFLISITSLGYSAFNKRYLFKDASTPLKLEMITLKAQSNMLNEVTVSGTMPVTVKEDTVEYRAADYPVRENSVVEDVLRKLPGVEVDKDGNVTSEGKSITRVRVNGKDFFDGDLKTATQNLPAEIIEKIQVIDDYGDQANVSGIRDGDPEKILNITIDPGRNKGMIANTVVGGGSDARKDANSAVPNDGRYQASGMAQFMNNDQQLSMLINLNNTNASLFDFIGGGNQRGGRFRGFGGGGGFRGGGGGSGITTTRAGGINYRNELSPKISIYGSYSVQSRNTDTETRSYMSTATGGAQSVITEANSTNNNKNDNHRLNLNFEYRIDSLNYLKVAPSFVYGSSSTDGYSNSLISELTRQNQTTNSLSDDRSPTFGGDLIYNHRFRKPGRNVSLNLVLNSSGTKMDQDVNDAFRFYSTNGTDYRDSLSHRLIYTDNQRFNTEAGITYSEPIGVYSRVDVSYNYNRASYDISRITQLEQPDLPGGYIQADSLSNVFDYSFTTNRFGLSYRYDRQKLYNFSVGLFAQPSLLEGYSATNDVRAHRSAFNFFPNARFVYNFARSRSLNVNYSGRANEPSYSQIQPVVDLSNPQRPVVGNPNLKSAFNQNINIRYNNFAPETGTFFNASLGGTITGNKIVSNVIRSRQLLINGSDTTYNLIQTTNYLNADGYYNVNGNYSWAKPFAERKYTLRLNGSAGYTNDIAYTDDLENTSKNWTVSQGLRVQINPNENIDITPGGSYRRSWVNSSLANNQSTDNATISLDLSGRIYFLSTFIWGFDASKSINQGYSSSVSNPFIINSYIEKQFFNRRGRLRLQGYDLLNEAQVVNFSPPDANGSWSESSSNRLTRYFLFSFAYRFSKFPGGGGERDFRGDDRRDRGGRDRGFGGPGGGG